MPELFVNESGEIRHTDEMQDIITAVPSWLLRWGITLFSAVLVLIFSLSAFIQYPDMIAAKIRIESPNSAKPVVAKIQGKLVKLLVKENGRVKKGQPLAYLESTANHEAVLSLLTQLKQIQQQINLGQMVSNGFLSHADIPELGELQAAYQTFFQSYLTYKSAVEGGFYLKKRGYLQKDLVNLNQQRAQLVSQKDIQQKDYNLAAQEYEMHQKLEKAKVESKSEFRQAESTYLSKKSPIVQTETSLISADGNYAAKQKEILELDNQIAEEKVKFSQALNSLISQAEDWKSKYILSASQDGKVTFAGVVQENELLATNQEVFYINPDNEQFFGEMAISEDNMGKVKEGQQVLIKLKSYHFEEYGMIRGKISYISDVPYKDSIFMSKVDFKIKGGTDMHRPIHLKQGMTADAEIITQDATILKRITWNLVKLVNSK